jgi:hypothetical protein
MSTDRTDILVLKSPGFSQWCMLSEYTCEGETVIQVSRGEVHLKGPRTLFVGGWVLDWNLCRN